MGKIARLEKPFTLDRGILAMSIVKLKLGKVNFLQTSTKQQGPSFSHVVTG